MLSRVADSIYWTSRYIERAENIARYIGVNLQSNLDNRADIGGQWESLVVTTGDYEWFKEKYGPLDGKNTAAKDTILHFLTFDEAYPNSILSCVTRARENARAIKSNLSLEAWEQLNKFYLMLTEPDARYRSLESPHDFYSEVRLASNLFEGIVDSTLSRGEEWNFLMLGKYMERANQTSRILDVKYFILLPNASEGGSLVDDLLWAALLHSVSGYEMFRRAHGRIVPDKVVEFLILDREFPRAVLFCLLRAEECLLSISGTPAGAYRNGAEKRISQLRSRLAYTHVEEIIGQGLHEFLDMLQTGLNEAGDAIYRTFLSLNSAETVSARQQ